MNKIEYFLKHNRLFQFVYVHVMSLFFRFLGLFIKTDENLVLFTGHGKRFNDSPRAIYNYMIENGLIKKYKCVWALDNTNLEIPGNPIIIKQDTFNYFITALRAKYWICCVNIERGLHFKKKNTIFLNTWHCVPTNYMGNAVNNRKDFDWGKTNYVCISGEFERPIVIRDCLANPDSIVSCGLPRNDILYNYTELMKNQIKEKFNIPMNKKIILYAPTWRDSDDNGKNYLLTPPINWKKWKKSLSEDYVILLRTHAYTTQINGVEFDDFIINCSEYPDVNDLMIIADILISDYSSIIFDYSILERPIISFGYDYNEYIKKRGFYFDLNSEFPNGVLNNEDDVLNLIVNMNYEEQCAMTKKLKDKFIQYGGHATSYCCNLLFKGDN